MRCPVDNKQQQNQPETIPYLHTHLQHTPGSHTCKEATIPATDIKPNKKMNPFLQPQENMNINSTPSNKAYPITASNNLRDLGI